MPGSARTFEDSPVHARPQGRGYRLHETVAPILQQMNPFPHGNPGGICSTCATETVRVLVEGKGALPIVAVDAANDQFDDRFSKSEFVYEEDGTEATFAANLPNRAHAVWTWLQNTLRGKVYIARGGGHIWNFVRHWDGDLYLIDMSMRNMRRLRGVADGQAPYAHYDVPSAPAANLVFDYLDPHSLADGSAKPLRIFSCRGMLSERWRGNPAGA